jgi:exodeoxyribonuclease VII small subunit
MSKNETYSSAFEELQQIVEEIEQGEISVDLLAVKVKRAAVLLKFCKSKLLATEEDVNAILHEITSDTDAKGEG